MKFLISLYAFFATLFIADKKLKKRKKFEIKARLKSRYVYGRNVYRNAKSVGANLFVGGNSFVTSNTVIGDNVCLNGLNVTGLGLVKIGNYVHSGIECLIISQNHNYDKGNAIPYDETCILKSVEIGDFVWIGSRVTILPGTKIGEGAIIQAGAVVHGKIPPYAIVGGNPAKVFKYRDIEHFQKLKEECKYYSVI